MALSLHKAIGVPLAEDIETATDLPHTLAYAIMYRERIDSFNELPKDKRPPRNLWDKPYALSDYFDDLWGDKEGKPKDTSQQYYDIDEGDVE